MSYGFHMVAEKCETCGRADDPDVDENYTSNVQPMFAEAFKWLGGRSDDKVGIWHLDGQTGIDIVPLIDHALVNIFSDHRKYYAMNPDNGWGDLNGVVSLLSKIKKWGIDYPLARLVVSA